MARTLADRAAFFVQAGVSNDHAAFVGLRSPWTIWMVRRAVSSPAARYVSGEQINDRGAGADQIEYVPCSERLAISFTAKA